jgi:hypothetical protein
VAFTGPVVSKCGLENDHANGGLSSLRVEFNTSLLGKDTVNISNYNKKEQVRCPGYTLANLSPP